MNRTFLNVLNLTLWQSHFASVSPYGMCGSLRNVICSKFHVDVEEGRGGGGGALTLWNISKSPHQLLCRDKNVALTGCYKDN